MAEFRLSGLIIKLRLLDGSEKPIGGARLVIQIFNAETDRWNQLMRLKTDAEGVAEGLHKETYLHPPALRVVDGDKTSLILAEGVLFALDKTSDETDEPRLVYDFGPIEVLDGMTLEIDGFTRSTQYRKRILGALPNMEKVPVGEIAAVMRQPASAVGVGIGSDTVMMTRSLPATAEATATPQADMQAVTEALAAKDRVIAAKTVETTQITGELQRTKTELVAINADLRAREAEIGQLDNRAKQAETERDLLRAGLTEKELQIETLERQIRTLGTDVTTAGAQKDTVVAEKDQLAQTLALRETELTEAQTRIADLEAQKAVATPTTTVSKTVGLSDLQTNLVSGLSSVDTQAGSNYRLGRMQVNVKALVTGNGDQVTLATEEQLKDATTANAFSDITVEYLPAEPPATAADGMIRVPDLTGLTVTAARRVLRSLGGQLEPATGRSSESGIAAGQAFRQSPAPASLIPRGDIVLVVFHTPPASSA